MNKGVFSLLFFCSADCPFYVHSSVLRKEKGRKYQHQNGEFKTLFIYTQLLIMSSSLKVVLLRPNFNLHEINKRSLAYSFYDFVGSF